MADLCGGTEIDVQILIYQDILKINVLSSMDVDYNHSLLKEA